MQEDIPRASNLTLSTTNDNNSCYVIQLIMIMLTCQLKHSVVELKKNILPVFIQQLH